MRNRWVTLSILLLLLSSPTWAKSIQVDMTTHTSTTFGFWGGIAGTDQITQSSALGLDGGWLDYGTLYTVASGSCNGYMGICDAQGALGSQYPLPGWPWFYFGRVDNLGYFAGTITSGSFDANINLQTDIHDVQVQFAFTGVWYVGDGSTDHTHYSVQYYVSGIYRSEADMTNSPNSSLIGSGSIEANFQPIPEPSTMSLIGAPLLVTWWIRRRLAM